MSTPNSDPAETVDLAVRDKIAFITINRPEALNALNEAVIRQLDEKFTQAEKNPDVNAIVFQGAGKPFVAGADIRFFVNKIKENRIADIEAFTRSGHTLFLRIENSPKYTIALLDGLSLGGGSEMALACQGILATPDGSMGFPETGIGIFPGLGGMLRFAKQVGTSLAKYFTFTGALLSAKDAFSLGIVTRLCEASEIPATLADMIAAGKPDKYRKREIPEAFKALDTAFGPEHSANWLAGKAPDGLSPEVSAKTLKTIGFKAPLALEIANKIIDGQATGSIEAGIELELGCLNQMFSTADALEGLQSTLDRRRPTFSGT